MVRMPALWEINILLAALLVTVEKILQLQDFAFQIFMTVYQVVQDFPVDILPIIVTLPLQVLWRDIFDFLPVRSCAETRT
jgi:hypothetical protein